MQLAPRHVGVTIAESSVSATNGGMNDEPRVNVRAGTSLALHTLCRKCRTYLKDAH